MPKQLIHTVENEPGTYIFWCPGCECAHQFDNRWTFNGDFVKPTFKPSLLSTFPVYYKVQKRKETRCHLFVENGRIRFLGDCDHELKGQTVDMISLDDV